MQILSAWHAYGIARASWQCSPGSHAYVLSDKQQKPARQALLQALDKLALCRKEMRETRRPQSSRLRLRAPRQPSQAGASPAWSRASSACCPSSLWRAAWRHLCSKRGCATCRPACATSATPPWCVSFCLSNVCIWHQQHSVLPLELVESCLEMLVQQVGLCDLQACVRNICSAPLVRLSVCQTAAYSQADVWHSEAPCTAPCPWSSWRAAWRSLCSRRGCPICTCVCATSAMSPWCVSCVSVGWACVEQSEHSTLPLELVERCLDTLMQQTGLCSLPACVRNICNAFLVRTSRCRQLSA